jgi:hypothetical protein
MTPGVLRGLGGALLVLGLAVGAVSGWLVAGDAQFHDASAAYARHPDHPLFRTEYWVAAARHWALVAATAVGLVGGLASGAILLALGELLRRVPPR